MDREQLNQALERFKNACIEKGYASFENTPILDFEEIYQGVYLVDVFVKKEWAEHQEDPLSELIDLLYITTEAETRRSILTLRLNFNYAHFFGIGTVECPSEKRKVV